MEEIAGMVAVLYENVVWPHVMRLFQEFSSRSSSFRHRLLLPLTGTSFSLPL